MGDWCIADRCIADRCIADRCIADRCIADRDYIRFSFFFYTIGQFYNTNHQRLAFFLTKMNNIE